MVTGSGIQAADRTTSWSRRTSPHFVAQNVTIQPITGLGGMYVMTNCYLAGTAEQWLMVDTGVPGTEQRTLATARKRFGRQPPVAIVLTHAHFDHYGSAAALSDEWDVPIYIHPLDLPYVTGRAQLPPYDPTVGGFVSHLSRMFPPSGTDLGSRVQPLPEDGSIPGTEDWLWIPTPGHTPGHISLFRPGDHTLLAGDALVTVDQNSAMDALLVRRSLHGPSTFATYDWPAAEASVRRLAELQPRTICTGHGEPISGPHVPRQLEQLAAHFRRREVPRHGRYVGRPVQADEQGVQWVPDPPRDVTRLVAGVAGAMAVAGLAVGAAMWKARISSSKPSGLRWLSR